MLGIALSLVTLVVALWPVAIAGQAESPWFVGAEAGRYDIHDGPGSVGAGFALLGGRRWGGLALQLSLTQGLGPDGFTALEPGLYLRIPTDAPVHALVGAGGGLMLEKNGSLAVPYFMQGGVGVQVSTRTQVRMLGRVGAHGNTGDPGTFRGPHMFTAGVVRSL